MTSKPSPPLPPPPEVVDQALALLIKAMEQDEPGNEKSQNKESGMTHLDRIAWRHQIAGEALQLAARKRAALFRRQRNTLIPINELPSEVLSAILIKCVNDDQPHRTKSLQMLAQVAWQWWQTIKSDPHFWTDITPPMEGVELQIRRAGILPLRLDWPDDVGYTNPDAFKNLVQRHAGRWTGIDLKRCGEDSVWQALCTSHFPHLKYLRVHLSEYPETMSENWRFNLAQCQNLQEVHLPIMPYLPVTPSLNSPIHLRTLHLDLLSMDSYSSHDLESLLRLIPHLVELKVQNLVNDTDPPASFDAPIIDLPNLQCLEFANAVTGDERECIPLLAQIRAPQLENLALRYDSRRFYSNINIDGQVIFTVLATWPSASTNRPEDAPLHSVLRNAGPSAAWRVEFGERKITVGAEGSGARQLDITLRNRHLSDDVLPEDILTHLAPFALPVDLDVPFWDDQLETAGLEFWDEVLDATPSLRIFRVVSLVEVARQVMDCLSTEAPSSTSTSPRASHMERLSFEFYIDEPKLWFERDVEEAVKTMLDKRREIFIQGGVQDPPKLVVTGPTGRLFDEAEGRWLNWESSDAGRGSEADPEEELA
ncbi:hypothetical protein FRC04_004194 [Tulasnella sp. 424]|nr:hypothetical protein FRC04_004194 [Tulasnella sp. 424]KAG8964028.1 hypothetical protein FRC05_004312 [Tulasnella sp. 425]